MSDHDPASSAASAPPDGAGQTKPAVPPGPRAAEPRRRWQRIAAGAFFGGAAFLGFGKALALAGGT